MYITLASPADGVSGTCGGIFVDRRGPEPWFTAHFTVTTPLVYLEAFGHFVDAIEQRWRAGDREGWRTNSAGNDFFVVQIDDFPGEVPDHIPAAWKDGSR